VSRDAGDQALLSSDGILAQLRHAAGSPHAEVLYERGDVQAQLQAGPTRVSADYDVPFLAHTPMEPMNCTVQVGSDGVEVWTGSQGPGAVRQVVAEVLQVDAARVRVHPQLMGGAFGRRTFTDVVAQAARVAQAVPGRPVQLVWTREQDIRHDFYRAAFAAQCRASLDAQGELLAWDIRLAGTSLGQPALLDPAREATVTMPYAPPHLRVSHAIRESGVPTGIWRSVAHSHNTFFIGSFLDELAAAAGADPWAFRRRLLAGRARHLHVLDTAARLSGWQQPLPPAPDGRPQALGLALSESFGSVVAQVARVSAAAAYDWNSFRFNGGVIEVNDRSAANLDGKGYWLGASYRLGQHQFKGQYVESKNDGALADGKTQAFGVGYQYDLSKRTALYSSVTRFKNDGVGYVSRTAGTIPVGLTSTTDRNLTEFVACIRHSF
jgi:isoquinoline 1-oxidoreductase beta subunit